MKPVKDRIYAFDTIRTIMVLLGIVIHASILYNTNVFNSAPLFNDTKSHSVVFNILRDLIHVFRMPVFFTISGFFTALLFFERGVKEMLSNRIHRLVYPFLAGMVILMPLHIFSLNFFAVSLSKFENAHSLAFSAIKNIQFSDINTAHLWFLYYLIWYCLTVLVLAYIAEKWFQGSKKKILSQFRRLFNSKAAPLLFSIFTLCCLFAMDTFEIDAEHSFKPDFGFYFNYAIYFLFGWLCYGIKSDLRRFEKQSELYLLYGLALFVGRWFCFFLYYDSEVSPESKLQLKSLLIAMLALNAWFFTFGIIGFFIKYFNHPSRLSRYLSDGSYWIYLIHMPIVIYFQSLLLPYNFPVLVKFIFVMLATIFVTVLSYNYLVRNTFIGKFLNGRRYPRGF